MIHEIDYWIHESHEIVQFIVIHKLITIFHTQKTVSGDSNTSWPVRDLSRYVDELFTKKTSRFVKSVRWISRWDGTLKFVNKFQILLQVLWR